MKNKNMAKNMIIILLISILLIGCNTNSNTGIDSDSSSDTSYDKKEVKIGVSLMSFQPGFMMALHQGIQEKAKELGVEIIMVNANLDAGMQSNQVEDLLTQGVDALLLNPVDGNAITPMVIEANQKGIPVFTVDVVANEGEVINKNLTDNYKLGKNQGIYISEKLKDKYGDYKGNIVNLVASFGTTSGIERDKGFMEHINQYPNIEVVFRQAAEWDQEKALNLMMNALQANSEIDAVVGGNDNVIIGAYNAIEQSGRFYPCEDEKHITLIGADGNQQAIDLIRKGKIDATVSQNPILMGANSIKLIVEYLVEGKIPPKEFESPQMLITIDNIDSSEVQDFGIWSEQAKE